VSHFKAGLRAELISAQPLNGGPGSAGRTRPVESSDWLHQSAPSARVLSRSVPTSSCVRRRGSGRLRTCRYRKFKPVGMVAPPAIVDGNRLPKRSPWALESSRTGAVLESGRTPRERPTSNCVVSGGASFVTMVKTADLRDRDHSAQLRRMHFPWFRRVLLQRQVRTGRVTVRKIRRQDSAQTGLMANDHVIQAFPPN
jgi:hypothetical protein